VSHRRWWRSLKVGSHLVVLWAPFERAYVKAGLGDAHIARQKYDSIWSTEQGVRRSHRRSRREHRSARGTAVGIEASDSLAIYRGGTRHNFGLNLGFALRL
jgi:hypothetical protein